MKRIDITARNIAELKLRFMSRLSILLRYTPLLLRVVTPEALITVALVSPTTTFVTWAMAVRSEVCDDDKVFDQCNGYHGWVILAFERWPSVFLVLGAG